MDVSVIGATGYTGVELVRLLNQHNRINLNILTSNSFVGEKIADIYPNLKGEVKHLCKELDMDKISQSSDIVFTALPHGISMKYVPELLNKGVKVIDLSGDYRYNNVRIYEKWYREHSSPNLVDSSLYGLVELFRENLKEANLIANPGCYPTVSLLSLAPVVKKGLVKENSIIIDAKSGATGAGRKLSLGTHFCEVNNNFKAYKVFNHRHQSEIEEKATLLGDNKVDLTFTPHLLPVNRGILATIYLDLKQEISQDELKELYQKHYQNDRFVRIFAGDNLPELKNVVGSNFCDIAVKVEGKRAIIVGVIDNLIKGSAGQAIQNMNLLAGFDETEGLTDLGLYL